MQLLLVKKICKDASVIRLSTFAHVKLQCWVIHKSAFCMKVSSKALSSPATLVKKNYPALLSHTFDSILLQIKYT